MWRKAALAVLWMAGVGLVAVRFGGGFEERSVETARLEVLALPAEEGEELPKALQLELEAEITRSGDRIRFVVEAGGVPQANPAGPEIELIVDGGEDVYLHVLEDGPRLPGGASWVRMDAGDAERIMPGVEGLLKLVSADHLLSTAPTPDDLEPAGHETIDGVETTIYEDTQPLERIGDVVGLSGDAFEQMQAAVGEDLKLTFWQDEDGFVRRFALPVAGSFLAPRVGGDELVVLQYTLEDLGEDLVVELPAEDDVTAL